MACVSVSVALLLAGSVSVAPLPAATVAVFTRSPVASGAIVPAMVIVSMLPGGRLAPTLPIGLRTALRLPQLAPPVATQVTVGLVIAAGSSSLRLTSVAVDGPALLTVTV